MLGHGITWYFIHHLIWSLKDAKNPTKNNKQTKPKCGENNSIFYKHHLHRLTFIQNSDMDYLNWFNTQQPFTEWVIRLATTILFQIRPLLIIEFTCSSQNIVRQFLYLTSFFIGNIWTQPHFPSGLGLFILLPLHYNLCSHFATKTIQSLQHNKRLTVSRFQ